MCRSAWFKFAWCRCDFTSKALQAPEQFNSSVRALFLKVSEANPNGCCARVCCARSEVSRATLSASKKADLINVLTPYCTSAVQKPLTPLLPVDLFLLILKWAQPQSVSVLCFLVGLECEGEVDVTSLWQMVPYWDVGSRIYGEGRMLLLNLRRCTVLPSSGTSSLPSCHSHSAFLSLCSFVPSLFVFASPLLFSIFMLAS